MEDLITRTGGESETRAGKLIPSFVIDTAGAPASATAPGEKAGAAPEWIELLPAGVFYGRDGRGPFRLDDPTAVIESTIALQMNAGLPIDYDHATDFGAPEGRPAPAAGWIRELEVRGGAVWGRVEWTARAANSIVAREYRYVSPVFQFDPKDGSVTRLLRAGLTNNPNLHLTAIAASRTAAADAKDERMEFPTQELRELLSLDGEATVADVVARVRELRAAGDAAAPATGTHAHDPAHYVAIAEFERALTELNALKAERARERAAHTVEEAIRAGKIVPAQREWAIAYCAADARGFQAFAAKQPSIVGENLGLAGEPPAERRAGGLNAAELAICSQLGLKHSEFIRRKRGRADFLSLERADADLRNAEIRSADFRSNQD
ncbi:MAG: phage protease [Candidatus Binatus sp.]|jgi:phage I-like protein|uniref:phage protease n=1 Tax=Candidatus Binatus sp. TaxID=2811406 RepID=UPI003D0A77E1